MPFSRHPFSFHISHPKATWASFPRQTRSAAYAGKFPWHGGIQIYQGHSDKEGKDYGNKPEMKAWKDKEAKRIEQQKIIWMKADF